MLPLPALPLLVASLLAFGSAQARTLQAKIAKVSTAVATLEGVEVRLDWPARATQGDLVLYARRIDAADLGYHYRDVRWHCPLQRDGQGGWRCDGMLYDSTLRSGRGQPLRLSLALGAASTDVVLTQRDARFAVRRSAATPDFTALELTRVPAAWAQALLAQAWPDARFKSGILDGQLTVRAPANAPLRIDGQLSARAVGLDTADGGIAAENLGGRFGIDYRVLPAIALLTLDGELRGGEFLAGNTYVALPRTPIALQIAGEQPAGGGWRLPRIVWRDGNALAAEGSAAFTPDLDLDALDLRVRSRDLSPLRERYLSGWLGLFGLGDLELSGALDMSLRAEGGRLASLDAGLHEVALRDPQGRFRFDRLDGDVRFSAAVATSSELRWQGGQLYGLDFGAATWPLASRDGALRLREAVTVPMLGGSLRFDGLALRPPAGDQGMTMRFGLSVDRLDVGRLAQALDWPAFRGELSGRIPNARYANDRLDFDGGLAMHVFDGSVQVSSLSMERPFGVAPTLSADLVLDDLDLLALTEVFDFGSITGRLDGRISDLRLVDWNATAFDATFHTEKKAGVRQRISQRAVQNISSVGDASFITSLQGQLIGLFDDFGYARIGISCRLANEVCEMGGLHSAGTGFTIVEGAGVPRLNVVGFNRQVDWPTLLERLAAVSEGEVKPVVE